MAEKLHRKFIETVHTWAVQYTNAPWHHYFRKFFRMKMIIISLNTNITSQDVCT